MALECFCTSKASKLSSTWRRSESFSMLRMRSCASSERRAALRSLTCAALLALLVQKYLLCLLYWFKSTCASSERRAALRSLTCAALLALLVQKYLLCLLYWYKSTCASSERRAALRSLTSSLTSFSDSAAPGGKKRGKKEEK
jgi:hypothetical protein